MRICHLGTAAGGGFPQWNCNCAGCRTARTNPALAWPRLQSSAALSADGRRWFLLNASPDVHRQLESFPVLRPRDARRGSCIEGVLLTSADLDHTLGLLLLREGGRLTVHAPAPIRQALGEGLGLDALLACYCGLDWREPPVDPAPLLDRAGQPTGLSYVAFAAAGKPPRYRNAFPTAAQGSCVGYCLVDEHTGGRLVYLPGVAELEDATLMRLRDCDALLLDGTFWSKDEMIQTGVGTQTAQEMGHLPVGGPGGSLERLAPLAIKRKVYVHMNNTNPILLEESPQRRAVESAGFQVGWDGLEFTL
jgi:pyrroloquinoline quinone biosynthesis protein B